MAQIFKIVSIGIIYCQTICKKSDEIYDVVKDMDLDVLFITETCLTGNVSDQKLLVMWDKGSGSYYLQITPN